MSLINTAILYDNKYSSGQITNIWIAEYQDIHPATTFHGRTIYDISLSIEWVKLQTTKMSGLTSNLLQSGNSEYLFTCDIAGIKGSKGNMIDYLKSQKFLIILELDDDYQLLGDLNGCFTKQYTSTATYTDGNYYKFTFRCEQKLEPFEVDTNYITSKVM